MFPKTLIGQMLFSYMSIVLLLEVLFAPIGSRTRHFFGSRFAFYTIDKSAQMKKPWLSVFILVTLFMTNKHFLVRKGPNLVDQFFIFW